jgi:hypothetical protein
VCSQEIKVQHYVVSVPKIFSEVTKHQDQTFHKMEKIDTKRYD